MVKEFVLVPLSEANGFLLHDVTWPLFLLIAASVFIAGGGYALNDYFDVKIDLVNKPDKVLIGKNISKKAAMLLHQLLTLIGMLTGFFLAWKLKNTSLAFIFIVVPGLLWFYSASYKRQLIIGNLIVAFLSFLTIIIVAITETSLLTIRYGNLITENLIITKMYAWTTGFAYFAFLLTWIREIIKDMEDEYGDREAECRTMPIVWGSKTSKIWVLLLILLSIGSLLYFNFTLIGFTGTLTLRYIIFGLIIPLCVLTYMLFKAKKPQDFHQASILAKVIMLLGLLYAPVFYFLTAKETGIKLFHFFSVQ